jgi:arginine decarboxylase
MNEINQSSAPLVEQLAKYLKEGYLPFHMPGHKGGSGVLQEWHDLLGHGVFSVDLTEVEGLDDLHHPAGPIGQAQRLAADLMGADEAFFLVNGATAGLHAAIMALCGSGDRVIIPRHAHRSVYEGVILSGAEPVYLKPEMHRAWGIPIGVELSQVDAALNRYPDAKCLVMVHPTYYGLASDLEAIGKLARTKRVPMVVDEAHGAHFKFSSCFPKPAIACGAFAVVQGWHKTMGSFTQSGLLLVKDHLEGIGLKDYLSLLQSTSPSYLLMGSLDAARKQWAEKGRDMAEKILSLSIDFRNKVSQLEGIFCLNRETLYSSVLAGIDLTKLVISGINLGLNGYELAQELRERYRIQPEMAFLGGVLLLVTIGDNQEKMERLFQALKDLASRVSLKNNKKNILWPDVIPGEMVMLPGKAIRAPKKSIDLAGAAGSVAGEFICPYPPGVPLVVPGEIISREALEIMEEVKRNGGHIQGPQDITGRTLRIID